MTEDAKNYPGEARQMAREGDDGGECHLEELKQKLESRIDDLEFALQHLINMVDDVNTKYATLTDALTRKTLERLNQGQPDKSD